jgi:transcriptional regulator with XRE-family HTH domain
VKEELRLWVREQRKQRGWSQAELAERSGIQLDTYRLFETKGKVSLARFLRILEALGGLDRLAGILRAPEPRSIAEVLALPKARVKKGVAQPPSFFGTEGAAD